MASFVPTFELRVWIACGAIIAAIVIPQFSGGRGAGGTAGLGFFGVLWMYIKVHWILSSIAGFMGLAPFLGVGVRSMRCVAGGVAGLGRSLAG